MPYAPATLRPRRAAVGRTAEQDYEARRAQQPWRAWYKTARWIKLRLAQLNSEPLCRKCAEVDRVTAATVCDHVLPHRGDAARFWAGPFQSLCGTCHSAAKQAEEQADLARRGVWD